MQTKTLIKQPFKSPPVCLPNMPKERGYNPVQAQRKAEKARTIKKGIVPTSIRCNVT